MKPILASACATMVVLGIGCGSSGRRTPTQDGQATDSAVAYDAMGVEVAQPDASPGVPDAARPDTLPPVADPAADAGPKVADAVTDDLSVADAAPPEAVPEVADTAAPDASPDVSGAPLPDAWSDLLWPECTPTTSRLLAMLPEAVGENVAMVADDTALYVGAFRPLTSGTAVIWSVSKTTGEVAQRWSGTELEGIGGLALDGADLYFTTFTALRRMPKAGGAVELLATGETGANAIVLDATAVYWASSGDQPDWQGRVSRKSRAGGAPDVLAALVRPRGLAIDGERLYTTSAGSPGGVVALPLGGGAIAPLNGSAGGFAMAATGTRLFVLSNYVVASIDKQTGAASTLYADNVGGAAITVDEGYVYWATGGYWGGFPHPGAGKILKAAQDGGAVTEIAICQPKPAAIAVDGTQVYWVNYVDGTVWLAPK